MDKPIQRPQPTDAQLYRLFDLLLRIAVQQDQRKAAQAKTG